MPSVHIAYINHGSLETEASWVGPAVVIHRNVADGHLSGTRG